jgi:DNA-binding MarR family transcriptional regulator
MATARSSRPSADALEVWQSWLRAHRMVTRRLDRELRDEVGMTLDDYDVLVQLAQAPDGRLRMSALADALLLARSSCTRLVSRLEERGWVARVADDVDGRVVWAELLPSGRAVQRRAAVVHLRGVQQHFARHLRAHDARCVGGFAARVVNAGR